jgi:AcrR family transcriptional regulator
MKSVAAPRSSGSKLDGEDAADGRRLRSSRNRAEIVRAMHALIGEGDYSPSAASVAAAAGVSLRTVFRHFDDMDSLYREMSLIVEAEVKPILQRPLQGKDWRERLDNLLERRAEIFEKVLPHKIAGSLRRFSSAYLMKDYERFIRMERKSLQEVLPPKVMASPKLFHAIEMATGFQAWRRMRQDQKLSIKDAREVMMFTVDCLLADV